MERRAPGRIALTSKLTLVINDQGQNGPRREQAGQARAAARGGPLALPRARVRRDHHARRRRARGRGEGDALPLRRDQGRPRGARVRAPPRRGDRGRVRHAAGARHAGGRGDPRVRRVLRPLRAAAGARADLRARADVPEGRGREGARRDRPDVPRPPRRAREPPRRAGSDRHRRSGRVDRAPVVRPLRAGAHRVGRRPRSEPRRRARRTARQPRAHDARPLAPHGSTRRRE